MSISVGDYLVHGRTHIVRPFLHKVGRRDALRSSDQIGSTERVREYRVDRNGANPRAATKYSVAAIPPSADPPPLTSSPASAFVLLADRTSCCIFSPPLLHAEMQIVARGDSA